MFDLDSLLQEITPQHLPDTPDNPQEIASRTTKEVSGTEPDTYPTHPTTSPTTPPTVGLLSGSLPDTQNAVLHRKIPEVSGCRVGGLGCTPKPHRDPDPSGCPFHWQRVPLLPEKGSRVALLTPDGYGALYRFKHREAWYVLKFLPPFDGRLGLRNELGQTWVFPSLGDLTRYLKALEEVTYVEDDVVII